jgi:hypothetical protein
MTNTNKKTNAINASKDDVLIFEVVDNNENIVKAISYDEGKKQEVFFYAIPEDEFDALIPSTFKRGNGNGSDNGYH